MSVAIPDVIGEFVISVVDSLFSWLLICVTPLDSDATVLLVVLKPVDNDDSPDDVDVDSCATALFVSLNPVDNDEILVEVAVDSDVIFAAVLVDRLSIA